MKLVIRVSSYWNGPLKWMQVQWWTDAGYSMFKSADPIEFEHALMKIEAGGRP